MPSEGISLGSVTVTVVPVAKGIDKSLRDQLEPAAAAAGDDAGKVIAEKISTEVEDAVPEGFQKGRTKAKTEAETTGDQVGKSVGDKVEAQVEDAVPAGVKKGRTKAKAPAQDTGDDIGETIGDRIKQPIEDSIPDGIDKGRQKSQDPAKKTGDQVGKSIGGGISPLIVSALVGAGTFGAAALLAGTSVAVAGIGVLIDKSNADIQAEYATLASDVGREMQDAASPIVPAVQTAMVQADNSIQSLGPTLKKTFADVAPDIVTAESGIVGMATKALPGLDTAINQSRGIVSGFFGGLPTLGTGVGQFFTGLTTNAQSTEKGLVDLEDVGSHALGALGQVAGSAAATLSTDFDAVTPALDGTLSVIQKLSSPPVIGGVLGLAGALKFDPAISGGLQKVSNGLTSVAAKAEGSTGLLGKAGGAAESAAGGFGKMADIVGGPWGVAIGAGVGLLSGLVSNLTQSVASVSDFTAAVAQDNGVVGSNTTAIIQKKLATFDLTTAQNDLGVSQTTLIEYAAGEASAQKTVQDAYNKKVAALKASGQVSAQNTAATVQGNIAAKAESDRLHDVLDKVDQVTAAVKGALEQQNQQNKAYLDATKSAGIFAGMVDTATTALQTQAQQQAINVVASLQLNTAQGGLGQQLSNMLYNYQLATAGAQGYNAMLTALHGTTASLDDAQNGLDQALLTAKTSFKANSFSLAENTQEGINNRVALSAAAKQIIALGVANYQAHGDIDQANGVVNQQIEAFVKATGATGKQKTAIESYLKSLAQIPPDVTTNVHANTSSAAQAVTHLLNDIDKASGTIQVYANVHNPTGGKALGANARGGDVQAGDFSVVGEEGPEIVEFGRAGRVIPNNKITVISGSTGALRTGAFSVLPTIGATANLALGQIGLPAAGSSAAPGSGYLPPAAAFNGSAVPQPVLSGAQWQQLAVLASRAGAGPGGRTTNMWVYPPAASAEQTAAEVVRRLAHAGVS